MKVEDFEKSPKVFIWHPHKLEHVYKLRSIDFKAGVKLSPDEDEIMEVVAEELFLEVDSFLHGKVRFKQEKGGYLLTEYAKAEDGYYVFLNREILCRFMRHIDSEYSKLSEMRAKGLVRMTHEKNMFDKKFFNESAHVNWTE